MSTRVLVNGVPGAMVSPLDRGLCYGDGLFETLLLLDGRAPLWERHMQRLRDGCARLSLPTPDEVSLWRETAAVGAGLPSAVVRITITRGIAERGYAPPVAPEPTRMVCATPAPARLASVYDHGIRLRSCNTRLAVQPALAGIKHLNRLEQVLARAECTDPELGEGLMFDTRDRVICATAANLFMVVAGRLCTPILNNCGVAGVARAEVLAHCEDALVAEFTEEDLMRAEEMFLTSSVRGVVPVHVLDGRTLQVGMHTRRWQDHWQDHGLAPGRVS